MGRTSGESHKLTSKAKAAGKGCAFKRGKKLSIPNAVFDSRYLWKVRGLKGGAIVHWLQKPTREEEAFARKYFDDFKTTPELLEECGFDLLLSMRGARGDDFRPQVPNSTWPWRILVSCVGEEDNTPEERMEQANKGIQLYNRTATKANYKFPRNVRFGEDLTGDEMASMDVMLLDRDVLNLMQAAYPHKTLEVMLEDDELMADFWTDIERGAEVIRTHIKSHLIEGNEDGSGDDMDGSASAAASVEPENA